MARVKQAAAVAAEPVEGPWVLPQGWRWDAISSIAEVIAGQSPPSSTYNDNGVGLPFYQGKAEFGRDTPTVAKWCSQPSKKAEPGDVLISVRAPVGPTNFAKERCGIGRGLAAIRATDGVGASWIRYWLAHSKNRLIEQATGTTFEAISSGILRSHPIPIPPLDTQRRIVARIDELFTELDDGEVALKRAKDNLEIYRKSLLKAAVTGELTAHWRVANPAQETGEQLLQLILADRKARWEAEPKNRGKLFVSANLPLDDDAKDFPKSWTQASIGQLFKVNVGATPARSEASLWNGDIPWVSSGEVAFNRIRKTRETITDAALRGSRERVQPLGTIMLGMIGEGKTRGQAAILDIAAAHNQNCASIRVPDTPIPPEYVFYFLRERYELSRKDGLGGNQPALNKARVEAMVMPLPPLEEMQQIVQQLGLAWDDLADLETFITEILRSNYILRQTILNAAFRGDLTT